MRNLIATLTAACALMTLVAHAPGSPFHVQAGAAKKPERPIDREKIIEEIAVDLEDVSKRLSDDDPGALTRKAEQRILDNIDILLKQKDPDQSSSSSSSPPKPKPNGENKPAPMPKPEAAPKPSSENKPTPMPKPDAGPKPQAKPGDPAAAKPKEAPVGETVAKANTIEEIRKEQTAKTTGDGWQLPPKHLQEIDSHARERFIRNYEEMLRAYYRNIAESSRRDP